MFVSYLYGVVKLQLKRKKRVFVLEYSKHYTINYLTGHFPLLPHYDAFCARISLVVL